MFRVKLILKFSIILSCSAFVFAHSHFYYHTIYEPAMLFKNAAEAKPYDAVIVPGIPCDGGKWNFIMKCRVSWSVYLYKKGIAKNIIYSGGAVYTPYAEALIMAEYAEKMGVPKEHIYTEICAEHSTENLYYSWELAKNSGFRKIAFATDPFQSFKVKPYIQKFGVDVDLIPMVVSVMEHLKLNEYRIESYKAYDLHFISIRDRETEEEQAFYSRGGRIKP